MTRQFFFPIQHHPLEHVGNSRTEVTFCVHKAKLFDLSTTFSVSLVAHIGNICFYLQTENVFFLTDQTFGFIELLNLQRSLEYESGYWKQSH